MLPTWIFWGLENRCFHCLLWIFDSGLKWWNYVSSWITNLLWKFLGLAWKWVRTVLEMSTFFSFCSGVNVLGTHLADSMLICKISVKIMWTKPELMLMDLAIFWTVMVNGINLIISGWGFWTTTWLRVIFCSVPAMFEFHSPLLRSCIWKGILSNYFYHILIDFLGCCTFLLQMLYDYSGLCFVHF